MKIAVIGTGYVGLVAGAGFSEFGNDVTCVDVDAARDAALAAGKSPIYEPGLEDLVQRNAAEGRLRFTTELQGAVAGADVVIVAVGTPQGSYGLGANLEQVWTAGRDIARALTGFAVIATKSTVPVGTADRLKEILAADSAHPFAVASNPEFLKEGDAVNDFMKPSRIIIGCNDERGIAAMRNLYAPFVRTADRVLVMDVRSAELSKYAANAMLATRISFMNELARLAEVVGADIESVRSGIGSDPRIGSKFLFPGPGFGGSCFPKDIRALAHTAHGHGIELSVVEAADRANERQKRLLGARVRQHFGGASLSDPAATETFRAHMRDRVSILSDMYAAVDGADALVLVTEWKQFRRPDFARIKTAMRGTALFDGRNIWNPAELTAQGFQYYGIGRPPIRSDG